MLAVFMLGSLLKVGFVGASLISSRARAAYSASGRLAPKYSKIVARRPSSFLNYSSIIDVQWRGHDPHLVA